MNGDNKKFIMCTGTKDSDTSGSVRAKGLVSGHCYSLISVYEEKI